jgi:hypothetical protein
MRDLDLDLFEGPNLTFAKFNSTKPIPTPEFPLLPLLIPYPPLHLAIKRYKHGSSFCATNIYMNTIYQIFGGR